jgi:hypothetical protein
MHQFHKKIKHLHCKCQSVSKIDGQRNQEGDGPGSGLVDRGQDRGARVRAAGLGTGRQGQAGALRSRRLRWAWLVAGTGLASVGCRVSGARGVDLRASPWPKVMAWAAGGGCLRGGGGGVGEEQRSGWRRGQAGSRGHGVRSGGWAAWGGARASGGRR